MSESMATSRAVALLRKPGQTERASFLELFFDLVFVFALTRVSLRLFEDVNAPGPIVDDVGQTVLLLLALLMVWFATAWITDLYDPQSPAIQLVVAGSMFGALVMGVALPEAFEARALGFAGAYVAIHIARGLVLVPALRGHEAQRRAASVLLWFGVAAVPWITGALVFGDGPARGVLWTLALTIELAGSLLLYPAPWIRRPTPQWPVVGEYMAERHQQFFIIALGELILVIGITYSAEHFSRGGATAAFVVAFATTVLLWRTYVYKAGELLPAAFAVAADPARLARRTFVAHMIMFVGVVVVAVGFEIIITHPSGPTEPVWVAVIYGGPILFLAGRAMFEYAVFDRVSRSRVSGAVILAAVAPVMILLPPLAVAVTAAAVLAGVVIADARRARRHPLEPPSPPA